MLKDIDKEQRDNLAFIGSLVKGVVHNVNTPLSAIMGRAEMLRLRLGKLDKQIEDPEISNCFRDVGLLLENCNRVSSIVKNAMQKTVNAENTRVCAINVSALLLEELEFFEADMEFKHNIEKIIHIDDVPVIKGVYVHFSNSFVELLENAVQAMADTEEKKLSVSLSADDSFISAVFHDTGCGIDKEQRKTMMRIVQDVANAERLFPNMFNGIKRVARLLGPYNAQIDIQSVPGDTSIHVVLPMAGRGV